MNGKSFNIDNIICNLKFYSNQLFKNIIAMKDGKDENNRYELVDKKQCHTYESYNNGESFVEGLTKHSQSNLENICLVDSYEILIHPRDEHFKFMIVSEGEGYVTDYVTKSFIPSSKYVTNILSSVFLKMSVDDLKEFNPIFFDDKFSYYTQKINDKLNKSSDDRVGAKVIMALIGPEYTCVSNLGNLRCYVADNNMRITQLNEEDSELWKCYRRGYFGEKEEIRFHCDRERNVSKIGVKGNNNSERFLSNYIFSSNSYKRIYLFSRGVIDCVSDDKLTIINQDYPADKVIEKIVEAATDGEKESIAQYSFGIPKPCQVIHGEKDATACVYVKKK